MCYISTNNTSAKKQHIDNMDTDCTGTLTSVSKNKMLFIFKKINGFCVLVSGLGGTCVNVGCIPKKLMHRAALLGQFLHCYSLDGVSHEFSNCQCVRLDERVHE